MKISLQISLSGVVAALTAVPAAADQVSEHRLHLPAQGIVVDLSTGVVTRKGISDQCLEQVSQSGGHRLVVSRSPGDDHPKVFVDGQARTHSPNGLVKARLSSPRLSPNGSLFHLQTWKTGKKQTELLRNGKVLRAWPRDTNVKLIQVAHEQVTVLLDGQSSTPRLVTYHLSDNPVAADQGTTLVDFGTCQPERLRIAGPTLWARMTCSPDGPGIYKIPLATGAISYPIFEEPAAEFISLPRRKGEKGTTVAVVDGNPSGMQFYYAATGLLLSQTGEVRSCASDAEGLQSWNQSYRTRALAMLYRKTGHPSFSALARKAMVQTLAAQNGRADHTGPSCGWGSTIYSAGKDDRLNLIINQAVIANSLAKSCENIGRACPPSMKSEISDTKSCLARTFEEDFDERTNLYRIPAHIEFKFSGEVAPWNWQVSFAALLSDLDDQVLQDRAQHIVNKFLGTWSDNTNGSLWRYWPDNYYQERGLSAAQINDQRFEDVSHAGISLLALSDLSVPIEDFPASSLHKRLDTVLGFGDRPPRDLNGEGPVSAKWFPAGGWAVFASDAFRSAYSKPVPGRKSADAIYAFAELFDPIGPFKLRIKVFRCDDRCQLENTFIFDKWQAFMSENPFFTVTPTQ